MRFSAADVMVELDAVVRQIMAMAEERCAIRRAPPPSPSVSPG
jgi:hypothetical protein